MSVEVKEPEGRVRQTFLLLEKLDLYVYKWEKAFFPAIGFAA